MSLEETNSELKQDDDAPTPTARPEQNIAQTLIRRDFDHDEGVSTQMTASYSEISFSDHGHEPVNVYQPDLVTPGPSRPLSLSCQSCSSSDTKPLDLEGTVLHDGHMTHFVADDLEYKIKISSPVSRRGDSPQHGMGGGSRPRSATPLSASLYRQLLTPQIGQVDVTVLNDLEYEARKIATSVDSLIENLSDVLHSISSLTAASVEAYRCSVGRACDALDRNIRAMYTVLARGEEVSRAMAPVRAHASRLAEIRRLLHIFESTL